MPGLALFCAVLCLAGCATASLQPLYTDTDAVFDPALLGVWRNADSKSGFDHLVAIRSTTNEYLVLRVGNDVDAWTARLVQIGSARFVDLSPAQISNTPRGLWIPAHVFGRISIEGDTLTVGLLDPDWVKAEKDQAAVLLPAVSTDPVTITAPTAKLREFAAANLATKAFGAVSRWKQEK